jgi:hypothetical protein
MLLALVQILLHHLLDTNEFLAVNDADVDTLLGIVEFASAATITESTENIDISFNVGEGMSVDGIGLVLCFWVVVLFKQQYLQIN